ncbi:MAG: ATP phosphoribosyltransferase regulatory subunit [Polyangiales bacterium]
MTIRRTLEHPLPSGMRDLLPPEASLRRAISRSFLGRAELHGYEPVIPPMFEYAETIERGLGTLDPREIVRFVEPETGEVVALRPDVTPQIARLVATRFDGKPPPYRLAYDASVLRRRHGSRARTHRQIAQLGLELIGVEALHGDVELVALAASSLQALGLPSFTIDIGHADIARTLLEGGPDGLADALGKKDVAEIARLASGMKTRDALVAIASLHGPPSILEALPESIAKLPAVSELRALVKVLEEALHAEGVNAATLTVDLGEVRGLAYYTGPFFQLFAEGPGVAIGAGGRYDQLLARFDSDRPLPASGLALDVDALIWALRVAKAKILERPARVVTNDAAFARLLRARGIAATLGDAEWARAWSWPIVAEVAGDRVTIGDKTHSIEEAISILQGAV